MTTHRTVIFPLAALLALLLAATAHAATISTAYCNSSLRGQAGQASDNDVRIAWDAFQRSGRNVTSSQPNPMGWGVVPNLTWNNGWRFYFASGGYGLANFRCYWGADGRYHDGLY